MGDDIHIPDVDYANGMEEVITSIDSLRREIEEIRQPTGEQHNPARSCKDIHLCHKDFKDGWYYIDPNQGCPSDSIKVYCNFTAGGETCIQPDIGKEKGEFRHWKRKKSAEWFSEFEDGFSIEYKSISKVQLTFLRLLSEQARQNFTFKCKEGVAWFHAFKKNYNKAIKIMGDNEEEFSYSKSLGLKVLADGCKNKNGETVFQIETEEPKQLPIIDFTAPDFIQARKKFGFEVGPVCFS